MNTKQYTYDHIKIFTFIFKKYYTKLENNM